jgi:hypothetical protein
VREGGQGAGEGRQGGARGEVQPLATQPAQGRRAKAEGEYEVAKERCDDQKGEQNDACEKQAKAKHDQAKAAISKQYAQRSTGERAGSGATRPGSTKGSTK